uniref:Uncharacterized protein wxcX n=1 Tax=Lygus hesperus TaxID=30085 RepID=A0A0A9Z8E2_LYGHE
MAVSRNRFLLLATYGFVPSCLVVHYSPGSATSFHPQLHLWLLVNLPPSLVGCTPSQILATLAVVFPLSLRLRDRWYCYFYHCSWLPPPKNPPPSYAASRPTTYHPRCGFGGRCSTKPYRGSVLRSPTPTHRPFLP